MSNLEYRLKYKDPQTGEVKQLSGGGVDIKKLKQEILQADNPVGCLRLQVVNTNPAEYLGFGEWELWGKGKVPVGVDENDTDFNIVEKTGGEKEHVLTINEMPSHMHDMADNDAGYFAGWGSRTGWHQMAELNGTAGRFGTAYTGGNQPHNNLPPYITVYMWARTA